MAVANGGMTPYTKNDSQQPWTGSNDYDAEVSHDGGVYTDEKGTPFGSIAGGTLYGARGIWFNNYNGPDFVLTNSLGATQSPPDYQNVNASHSDLDGTISTDGGVNIFVAEVTGDGGTVIKNKYTATGSTINTITVTAVDTNRTLQAGVIRIGDTKYAYTGVTATQFTGVTPDSSGIGLADFYTPLMDRLATTTSEVSNNLIYNAVPFWVITSVRRYGTKPYDVYTQFGSTGLPFTPILADDPQAS